MIVGLMSGPSGTQKYQGAGGACWKSGHSTGLNHVESYWELAIQKGCFFFSSKSKQQLAVSFDLSTSRRLISQKGQAGHSFAGAATVEPGLFLVLGCSTNV